MALRPTRPVVVLFLFWAALFLPRLLLRETLPARDVAATQIPWRMVWREQVTRGHLPIWDPSSNHGRPLAANPNAMAFYPGTLLFLVADPEMAAAWHLAIHQLLLLFGCYHLARRCGAEPAAAGVAAAGAGSCGVAVSLLTFMNAQATFAWAAWALATAVDPPRSRGDRHRRAFLGGALLGIAALGGEPVAALLAAAAWAALVLAGWRRGRVLACAVGGAAALLVAAPVLVPLLAVLPDTGRGAMGTPETAVTADTLAPRRLLELFAPNLLGPPLADRAGGFWARPSFPWQRYYPVLFPGALLLLTVPIAGGRRELRPWWALLVAGIVASALLGWELSAGLVRRPLGEAGVRFGIKLLLLSVLAAVPLAAAGWRRLAQDWPSRGRKWAALAGVAAAALALPAAAPESLLRPALARLYPASHDALAAVDGRRLSLWLASDAAALAAVPLALAFTGPSAPVAMATALVANAVAGRGVLLFDEAARWARPPAILAELPPRARVAASGPATAPPDGPDDPVLARYWAFRSALAPNYGTRWQLGYALCRGPDGLEPVRQELLAAAAERLPTPAWLRLAAAIGVDAVVGPAAGTSPAGGVPLLRLPGAPEVYMATRVIPCEGAVAAADALAAASFRPGEDAVVDGRGAVRTGAGGRVRELPGRPDRRLFDVESSGPGLLVVQQSYVGAWRARIDGRHGAVQAVNFAFVGVDVPPGRHRVELRIDPRPYWLGLGGPLVALALALLPRRRAAAPPSAPTAANPRAAPWPDRRAATGAGARSFRASPPGP